MALNLSSMTPQEQIATLFIAYFDRAPAPSGLDYWVGRLNDGMSIAEIATSFAAQPETLELYALDAGNAANADFHLALVTDIFNNLFGREPAGGADNYWVQQLNNGADIGTIIINIASGATGDDKARIENKIEAGLDWASDALIANIATNSNPLSEVVDGNLVILDEEAYASAKAVLDTVTEDPATVDAAKAATDGFIAGYGNDAPIAANDTAAVNEDGILDDGVISTAADPDGDALTYSVAAGGAPANGTVVMNADGTYVYTPDADFNGTDTFTYTVTDPSGETDSATVTVTVAPQNDAPIAGSIQGGAIEGGAVATVDLKDVTSDVDGDTLTYALVTSADGLSIDASTGVVSLDPTVEAYDGLAQGETLQVVAGYSVSDGAKTVQGTVQFTVTGTNDAPVASASVRSVDEDGAVFGTVRATDVDGSADNLVYSVEAGDGPSNGTVNMDADGAYIYNPTANFNGTDSFTYTVTDANGASDTQVVTINVTPVDDAPVAEDTFDEQIQEGEFAVGQFVATDIDSDPALIEYTLDKAVAGLTLEADGAASFDAGDPAYEHLSAGETLVIETTYTVTSNGLTDKGSITITITGTNDDPVASLAFATVAEDGSVSGTVVATDVDNASEDLVYSVEAGNGPANGTLSMDADGTYTYTPDADFNGTDEFTYTVTDPDGGQATAVAAITVTAVDDAPVASDATTSVNEDATISGQLVASDVDNDDAAIVYTLDTNVAGLTLNADGSWDFDASNSEYQSLAAGETQVVSTTYTATSNGKTDAGSIAITVTGTNDGPQAQALTVSGIENLEVVGRVQATDIDGDTLTFTVVDGSVQNGTVSMDAATGAFTFTPNPFFSGEASFEYTVSDGDLTSTETVTIDVADVVNVLTTGVDNIPLTGEGVEVVRGSKDTLNPGDRVSGGEEDIVSIGIDGNNPGSYSAFEIDGIGKFVVTNDGSNPVTFDMSSSSDIKTLASENSTNDVRFDFANMNDVDGSADQELNVEVRNLTNGVNFTLDVRDIDQGGDDIVHMLVVDSDDDMLDADTINIVADSQADGSTMTASGIEEVNLSTAGSTGSVRINDLNTYGVRTLNISTAVGLVIGDAAVAAGIENAISGTIETVDATGSTGSVTLSTVDSTTGMDVTGGDGGDVFELGATDDTVDGGAGDDTITASGGHNTVTGGTGDDVIVTGAGNDVIDLGEGDDFVNSGAGDDTITNDGGNNTVVSGDGDDTITLGNGNNDVNSGDGDDSITLGHGNNIVDAGEGANTITAGDGDNDITAGTGSDTITLGHGDNIVNAGDGTNTITAGDGDNDITSGGAGTDEITLGHGNNVVDAGDGTNIITAGDGVNEVFGGADEDSITLGDGGNLVEAGAGNDSVTTGDGIDGIDGGDGDDILSAGGGDDLIFGGAGADDIYGGAGADVIDTGDETDASDEFVDAGTGDDTVNTRGEQLTGADVLRGGADNDTLNITMANGATSPGIGNGLDNVTGFETINLNDGIHTYTIAGGSAFDNDDTAVTIDASDVGKNRADSAYVDASALSRGITLLGGDGDDTFIGGEGADTFRGDADSGNNTGGADSFDGNGGDDVFQFGDYELTGGDTIEGGTGYDKVVIIERAGNPVVLNSDFSGIEEIEVPEENITSPDDTTFTLNIEDSFDNAGDDTPRLFVNGGALLSSAIVVNHNDQSEDKATDVDIQVAGGAQNDTIRMGDALDAGDEIDGGLGDADILELATTSDTSDADFTNVSNIEILKLTGNGAGTITLGQNAFDAGIKTVDASATLGLITIDASGFPGALTVIDGDGTGTIMGPNSAPMTLKMGLGNDTITTGSANDILEVDAGELTFDDVITDNGGVDSVVFQNGDAANAGGIDASVDLTNVTGIEEYTFATDGEGGSDDHDLVFRNGDIDTLTKITVDASPVTDADDSLSVTLEATVDVDYEFDITGTAGNDLFVKEGVNNNNLMISGADGDDILRIDAGELGANVLFDGGEGGETDGDALQLSGGAFTDDDFVSVVDGTVERLITVNGVQMNAVLGAEAASSGIGFIDMSDDGGSVLLDPAFTNDLEVVLGSAFDEFDASATDVTLTIHGAAADLNNDIIKGGSGPDDVINVTADNTTADVTQVSGIESYAVVEFGDANVGLTFADSSFTDVASGRLSISATALDDVAPDAEGALTVNAGGVTGSRAFDIVAGTGDDNITTGSGDDVIDLGEGNDFVDSGAGNDTITNDGGDNTVVTGDGDDSVTLGDGGNIVEAGAGDDNVTLGNGSNIVDAGEGQNTVLATDLGDTANAVDGDTEVSAGAGDDDIQLLTDGDHWIEAGDGANFIVAHDGDNTVIAGSGSDSITLGDGDNTVDAGDGNNDVLIGSGNNSVTTGSGVDVVTVGSDFVADGDLTQDDGDNVISTGGGADIVVSGDGNDEITGGGAADILTGGEGADEFRYVSINDSRGLVRDTITDFVEGDDLIEIETQVIYEALSDRFLNGPNPQAIPADYNITTPMQLGLSLLNNAGTDNGGPGFALDGLDAQGAVSQNANDYKFDYILEVNGVQGWTKLWVDVNDDGVLNGQDLQIFLPDVASLTGDNDVVLIDTIAPDVNDEVLTLEEIRHNDLAAIANGVNEIRGAFDEADADGAAADDEARSGVDDTTMEGQLNGTDSGGGPVTYTPDTVIGTYGTFTVLADGSYTYTAAATGAQQAAIEALDDGEHEMDTFTVTASDGYGNASTSTVTVNVTGADDAPIFDTAAVAATIIEDGATTNLTGDIDASDVDGDVLTFGLTGGTDVAPGVEAVEGTYGTLEINQDSGQYEYVQGATAAQVAAIQALAEGQSVSDTFTVELSDGDDAVVTQAFAVSLTGTNDAPDLTVTSANAASFVEDAGALEATFDLNVVDIDTNDDVDITHTATLHAATGTSGDPLNAASDVGFDVVAAEALLVSSGVLSNLAADAAAGTNFSYTFNSGSAQTFDFLSEGEVLEIQYEITADDGLATDTQVLTVTITGTNDAPIIDVVGTDANSGVATEDLPLGMNATLSITDLDVNDVVTTPTSVAVSVQRLDDNGLRNGSSTTIEAILQNDIDNAQFTVAPGTVIGDASQAETLTWTFDPHGNTFDALQFGDTLTLDYDVTVTDQYGSSETETVSVVINGVNDDVSISGYSNTTGSVLELEDASTQTVTVDGTLTLHDLDVGDLLTPDAINGAVNTVTIGATGRDLTSDAAFLAAVGTSQASIAGLADDADVTFTPASTASNGGDVTVDWQYTNTADFDWLREGETLTIAYDTTATDDLTSDTNVDELVVTIVGTNDALTNFVDGADLTVIEDGATTDNGTVTVRDQDVGDTIDFTVSNPATVVLNNTTLSVVNGAVQTDTLNDNDIDANVWAAANLTVASATSNGTDVSSVSTFDLNGADTQWLRADDVLTLSYEVDITDNQGSTITETVTVTVEGENDSFVIGGITNPADITEIDPQPQSIADQAGSFTVTDPDVGDVLDYAFGAATVTWYDDGNADITSTTTDYDAVFNTLGALTNLDFGGTDLTAGTADAVTVDWDWSLDGTTVDLDFLDDGERIEVDYEVTVTDGTFSDTMTVNLTFTGTNDAPVIDTSGAGDSATGALTEGDFTAGAEASGTLTVFDADRTDVVSLQGITASVDASSTVLTNGATQADLNAVGLDNATLASLLTIALPNNADTPTQVAWEFNTTSVGQFDILGEGETLVINYVITAEDDNNVTDTQDVTITVTGTNDAPTLIVNRASVDSNSISLTASDPDANDTLQLEVAVGGVQDIENDASATKDFDVEEQGSIKVTDLIVEDQHGAQGDSGYVLVEGTSVGEVMSPVASGQGIYYGFGGADNITGGGSDDIIFGGNDNDVITGGAGTDIISGENGDDLLNADQYDTVDGGVDNDTAVFTAEVTTAELEDGDFIRVENVTVEGAHSFDFGVQTEAMRITGDAAANTIVGGTGSNVIWAGNGADNVNVSASGGGSADKVIVVGDLSSATAAKLATINTTLTGLLGYNPNLDNTYGSDDIVIGETITFDGTGTQELHVFGTVNLANATINGSYNLFTYSETTLKESQLGNAKSVTLVDNETGPSTHQLIITDESGTPFGAGDQEVKFSDYLDLDGSQLFFDTTPGSGQSTAPVTVGNRDFKYTAAPTKRDFTDEAIEQESLQMTAGNPIGGNPNTSGLVFDDASNGQAGNFTSVDNTSTDPVTSGRQHIYVGAGDRYKGADFISNFEPGHTKIPVPTTFAGYGDDRVHNSQFEVYFGDYDVRTDVFTVTGSGAGSASGQYTLVLYDNDESSNVEYVEGLVFANTMPERSRWFIENPRTPDAELQFLSQNNVVRPSTFGTDADDTLIGSSTGYEYLYGLDGDDTLTGGTLDYMFAGEGADTVHSGSSFNIIDLGDSAFDAVRGDGATDTVVIEAQAGVDSDSELVAGYSGGAATGEDFVFNFELARDVIKVVGTGIGDYTHSSSVASNVSSVQIGAGRTVDTVTVSVDLNGGGIGAGDVAVSFQDVGDTDQEIGFDERIQYELTSTSGNDTIIGGDLDDVITSGGGNDVFRGEGGNDTLWGRTGNDTLIGGAGHDTVAGYWGDDTIVMEVGSGDTDNTWGSNTSDNGGEVNGDTLKLVGTAPENVIVDLSVGQDTDVFAYASVDDGYSQSNMDNVDASEMLGGSITATAAASGSTLIGTAQNDTLNGGAGADYLVGGAGDDTINGGDDDDVIIAEGNDVLTGGAGYDAFAIAAAGTYTATITDLGVGTDKVQLNTTQGGAVSATLGADFTADQDTWNRSQDEAKFVINTAGYDVNLASTGSHSTLAAGFTVVVDSGTSSVVGSRYADNITGGAGDDIITGGAGVDVLTGGAGVDTFVYTSTGDTATSATDYANMDILDGFVVGTDKLDISAISTTATTSTTRGTWDGATFTAGAGDDWVLSFADGGTTNYVMLKDTGESSYLNVANNNGELTTNNNAPWVYTEMNPQGVFVTGGSWTYANFSVTGERDGTTYINGFEVRNQFFTSSSLEVEKLDTSGSVLSSSGALSWHNHSDGWPLPSGKWTEAGGSASNVVSLMVNPTDYNIGSTFEALKFIINGPQNSISSSYVYGDSTAGDTINFASNTDDNFFDGRGGNDDITAGSGDDLIFGGAGDDTITGGAGDDKLTGGDGADTFVYATGSDGTDTITDFETGVDKYDTDFAPTSGNFTFVTPTPTGGGDRNLIPNSAGVFEIEDDYTGLDFTSAAAVLNAIDANGNLGLDMGTAQGAEFLLILRDTGTGNSYLYQVEDTDNTGTLNVSDAVNLVGVFENANLDTGDII